MAINRAQIKKQLQEGLNSVFGLEYDRRGVEWKAIFEIYPSRKAYEEDVMVAGFGLAPTKPEGSGLSYDEAREVWTARYQNETIALGFSITEEALEDGLYGDLGATYAKALARSMQETKEVKAAAPLNNGFSSSFLGGDGKALFVTDHPLSGGGTFRNTLTTAADLSESSLEEALIDVGDFVDERGIKISVRPNRMIVPNALQFVAQRLLMSPYRPGTADNDVNAVKTMGLVPGGFSVNHYLTDTDAWFLINDGIEGLKHFSRVKMSRGMEGDFESGNMRYKARERYVFGWSDPRGAYASPGA